MDYKADSRSHAEIFVLDSYGVEEDTNSIEDEVLTSDKDVELSSTGEIQDNEEIDYNGYALGNGKVTLNHSPDLVLQNREYLNKLQDMCDEDLAVMTRQNMWKLYENMGNLWPSFLRYENPPPGTRIRESRFFNDIKSNVIPSYKESNKEDNISNADDSTDIEVAIDKLNDKVGYSNLINLIRISKQLLKKGLKEGTYDSVFFDTTESARYGLIAIYLAKNGIRKGMTCLKCQYCGSSKCERRAVSCPANRCFKCLLKGHLSRFCRTSNGYFFENYYFPAKKDRDFMFFINDSTQPSYTNLINVAYCICPICGNFGHISCAKSPLDLASTNSEESKRFEIYQGNNRADYNEDYLLPETTQLSGIYYFHQIYKSYNNEHSSNSMSQLILLNNCISDNGNLCNNQQEYIYSNYNSHNTHRDSNLDFQNIPYRYIEQSYNLQGHPTRNIGNQFISGTDARYIERSVPYWHENRRSRNEINWDNQKQYIYIRESPRIIYFEDPSVTNNGHCDTRYNYTGKYYKNNSN
ncbi:hypothetical protein cand_035430 [Cryptosporidium andersoni]|uniref:CCHC-type domain-containing protein n=1 Tax=Cryptosporidium andersoni TaxID=117008 RepID=A0A1J4MYG2_9CRYT|nr:hypothetical protein cand_035430 [Cryptosporidium andersoni]